MLHRRAAFLAAGGAALAAGTGPATASPGAAPGQQVQDPHDAGFEPDRLARIGNWFKAEVEANRIPGAVVAIGRRGKLAYLEAFGYRDRESGAPLPRNAIFRIASMTKPFASLALMLLVEEGKCALWHPVARYLPEFANPVVGMERAPATREIRVQDLLRHTSGLTYGALPVPGGPGANSVQQAYAEAKVADPDQTSAEFIKRLAAQPLICQPGTHWEYSHSTDVVGRLVEVISGQDLNAFIQDRICKPLGLTDTGFWAPQSATHRVALPQTDPSTGRKQPIPNPLRQPKWYSGGGGMVSTASDYARFCQMLLNGGELDEVKIASRKTIELMASDHLPPGVQYGPGLYALFGGLPPSPEVGYGFGLGFAVRTMEGRSPVPGSVGDYFWAGAYGTYFWVDPSEELYAVMMLQGPADRVQYRYAMRSLVYGAFA